MPGQRPYRNTPQRRIILQQLRKMTTHPTAAELYEEVRRQMPKISLGTVYRNLDLLVQQGTIQKHALSGGETRYDGDPEHHDHIRCVRCGRMDDFGELDTPQLDRLPRQAAGYQILGHRLEFFGICPDCASQKTTLNIPNRKECAEC